MRIDWPVWPSVLFVTFEPPFQLDIFGEDPLEIEADRADLTVHGRSQRTGNKGGAGDRFGGAEIRLHIGHDDASLDVDQVNSDEGDAHKCVDHDTLVEHAIQD